MKNLLRSIVIALLVPLQSLSVTGQDVKSEYGVSPYHAEVRVGTAVGSLLVGSYVFYEFVPLEAKVVTAAGVGAVGVALYYHEPVLSFLGDIGDVLESTIRFIFRMGPRHQQN